MADCLLSNYHDGKGSCAIHPARLRLKPELSIETHSNISNHAAFGSLIWGPPKRPWMDRSMLCDARGSASMLCCGVGGIVVV